MGWVAVRTRSFPPVVGANGELLVWFVSLGPEDHGEGLRRSRDDAAGV